VSQRMKILAAVVATLALVGGYWHFAVAPQRAEAARLADQVAAKEQAVASAEGVLATYRKAKAAYPVNYATLVRLGKAVPQDDDTRSLLVQLDSAARRSGVDFRTLTVSQQSTSAGTASTTGSSTASTGTSTASAGTTGSSTASTATGAAGSTPPPGAVAVGAAGFSAMPFTFSFRGRFSDLSRFFSRLQRFVSTGDRISVSGRLLRLDSVTVKPDAAGFPQLRADVTASSFLLPATEGLTAGGTAAGPAAAPSASAAAGTGAGTGAAPATTTATVTGAPIR
jgi:hypothetical protein